MKDRIPSHQQSSIHKANYVKWKLAQRSATTETSVGSLILRGIETEAQKWQSILERILHVILFLSERGLAFFGSNEHIGNAHNGNFLGIIELLSEYDPISKEHVGKVKESQQSKKKMQVHYLSSTIQNEFIELIGSTVQNTILNEIKAAKYYSIMVDSTPDCSHSEQHSFIMRFVKISDTTIKIEERFIMFNSFPNKIGTEIAAQILNTLTEKKLNFSDCIGQG